MLYLWLLQIVWIGFDLALMAEVKKQFPTFKVFHVVALRKLDRDVDMEHERQLAMKMVNDAKAANLDGSMYLFVAPKKAHCSTNQELISSRTRMPLHKRYLGGFSVVVVDTNLILHLLLHLLLHT